MRQPGPGARAGRADPGGGPRAGRSPTDHGARRLGHLSAPSEIEDLLRTLAPQVLAALVRRHDDFDVREDAVQEALLAAAVQWPSDGVPANPRGWLTVVASRWRTEMWRSESARRRREEAAVASAPADIDL